MARQVRIVRVAEVTEENVPALLREAQSRKSGLNFYKRSYKMFRRFLAQNGLKYTSTKKRGDHFVEGYYSRENGTGPKVMITYGVKSHTNSEGYPVKATNVKISA